MQKPDRTKEMSGEEANVEQKDMDSMPQIRNPKKLRCLRTAEMPNIGLFHEGDIIEDQRLVALINDNPNFEDASQGE